MISEDRLLTETSRHLLTKLDSAISSQAVPMEEKQLQLKFRSQIVDAVDKQRTVNHSFIKAQLLEALHGKDPKKASNGRC